MVELCIAFFFLDACQHWSTRSFAAEYGGAEGTDIAAFSKPQARHLDYHGLWLDNNLPQYPEYY